MSQPNVRLALRLVHGDRAGELVPIPESGLTVGRNPANDLVLADPSVSGRHALLRLEQGSLWLLDLESTNGTKLAGRKVGRTELAAGDRVAFGTVECEVVAQGAAAEAGPAPAARAPRGAPERGEPSDLGELSLELEDEPDLPPPRRTPAAEPPPRPAVPARPVPARAVPARAVDGAAPAPPGRSPGTPPAIDADPEADGGDLSHASLAGLEAARKRSRGGPFGVLLVVLLGLGGGAAYWFSSPSNREGGAASASSQPREFPGNGIRGGHMEAADGAEGSDWVALEGSTVPLERGRRFAASGLAGLGAEGLRSGESALAGGPAATVRAGQVLELAASVRVRGGASARLGVELSRAQGAGSVRWFGPSRADQTEFAELGVAFQVPAGFDRLRPLLWAAVAPESTGPLGEGTEAEGAAVAFDDVRLLPAQTAPTELVAGDWRFVSTAPDQWYLMRFDALVAELALVGPGGLPAGTLEAAVLGDGTGFSLSVAADREGARMDARFAAPLYEKGIATLAPADRGGYRVHAPRFAREGAEALLLGEGVELVELRTESAELSGAPADGFLAVQLLGLKAPSTAALRVVFQGERVEARRIAEVARAAQVPREQFALWSELLERYPYDGELVREAESALASLVEAGAKEFRALEAEAERARFFALPELLERAKDAALDLAQRYGGSEVALRAAGLAEQLEGHLARASEQRPTHRAALRAAMGQYFQRSEQPALADRLTGEP